VGLFNSFLNIDDSWRFYLLGPLAFLVHPTAAVLLPIPFIALFLAKQRQFSDEPYRPLWAKDLLLRLLAWCLLVFAVNAIWILPLVRYLDIKLPSEAFFQIRGSAGLFAVLVKPGNLPAIFLCLLSLAGSIRLIAARRVIEFVAPASAVVFLLCLAGYGVYVPGVNQMEPGRFLYSAMIFMSPLSAVGLKVCFDGMCRVLRGNVRLNYVRTALLVVLFVLPPWLGLLSSRAFYKHTLSTTIKPEIAQLIAALQEHADRSGRVMVEDGTAWRYGNSHFPSILPLFTGIEQIGGPYPHTFIKHHFATFQLNKAMGKPLMSWQASEFQEYLALYNIRWIVTTTPEVTAYIEKLSTYDAIWSSAHFTLWRGQARTSFADVSNVSVRADYNLIEVTLPLRNDGILPQKILLKYHWDRALRVEPPARISQAMRLDDPVPFIVLEPNGAEVVRITYR
ncbi:MAG: hypothetical protein ABIA59_09195, partial [Candidatus Latescibacterota bacterium]